MEKICEFFEVDQTGGFICKKIIKGSPRITKDICKEHCPVFEKRCLHLAFSLRKDEFFSALGIGGRRYEIKFENVVCGKIKEPIFDIKKCYSCVDFEEGEVLPASKEEIDIVKEGLRILVKHLGEEKTRLFMERIKKEEKLFPPAKDELDEELKKWFSLNSLNNL